MICYFDEQDKVVFKKHLDSVNKSRRLLLLLFSGIGVFNILLLLIVRKDIVYGLNLAALCFSVGALLYIFIGHQAKIDMKEQQKEILVEEIQNKRELYNEGHTEYSIKINKKWINIDSEEYTKYQAKELIQIHRALKSKTVLRIKKIEHS